MRRPTSVSATRAFHGPVKVIAATALAAFAVLAAGGADSFSIVRDLAALARDPRKIPVREHPSGARKVIGFGYSTTGGFMRGFFHEHGNTAGGLAFDGALYGGAGGSCVHDMVAGF